MSSFFALYFYILLLSLTYGYDKFKIFTLYEVTAFNVRERALLYYLYVKNEMIMFVNGITNEATVPMDVIVDGCCTKYFETKLRDNDIEYVVVDENFLVKKPEDRHVNVLSYPYARIPKLTKEFHSFEALMLWFQIKLQKFPFLSKIQIAKTYEHRDVIALKISSGTKNSAVFLLGGEDGRDWLSPAILINFIDYILEQKLNVDLLIKHYDFYILPVFNPDGYEHSVTKDWSWSRNRKIYFPKRMCLKNSSAIGINLDRNWYFSKDIIRNEECDPVYSGSKSVSEEETAGLAKFLDSISLQMLTFINIRGFDQLVTVPYGYSTEQCNNYPVLMDILSSVHDRVREEHNKTFFYGTAATYFYNFSGNVADWVKKNLNTPIVYTIYMKAGGYILPSPIDVEPLTDQFSTMIKEILLLASSIYSPLFNNQMRNSIQIIVTVLNIFTIFVINVMYF